jgi:hypothetical protein
MSTAVATSVVGDLILTRLLASGKRPPAPKRLREDIARFFKHPPGGEAWQGYLDELVQAGLLTVRPYRLTDAGRARALELLGLKALPPRTDWKAIRNRYLVPMALGIPPTAEELRKRAADASRLPALLIQQHFDLPAEASTSLAKVLAALACKQLDIPVEARCSDIPAAILSRLPEIGERLSMKSLKSQLPRRLADASKGGADALRQAVLRRWLDAPHSAVREPTRPNQLPPTESPDFDLPAFAATVRAAARDCPTGRFGDNKVFISYVWRHLRAEPGFPAMDLPAFKQRLTEANHTGLLRLERADLVQAMDPADVRESETPYLNAVFHFILVERDRP